MRKVKIQKLIFVPINNKDSESRITEAYNIIFAKTYANLVTKQKNIK